MNSAPRREPRRRPIPGAWPSYAARRYPACTRKARLLANGRNPTSRRLPMMNIRSVLTTPLTRTSLVSHTSMVLYDISMSAYRPSAHPQVQLAALVVYLTTPSIVSARKVISSGTRANAMSRHTHGFTNVTIYPQISHT